MNSIKFIQSWVQTENTIEPINDLISWINRLNYSIHVNIRNIPLDQSGFWFYDKISDVITNKTNSFFSIQGIQMIEHTKIIAEQPIIVQNEIGYLGIICKEFNDVLYFLMQAKIEPGNINKIQISPTIQATKSNFTAKHGGRIPAYLEYFINSHKHEVIVDQIQSEQSSRFYKKRNRNIIIKVEGEVPVLSNFKWMTLGQIKILMRIDNLVNMDTRTVLSCIPFKNISKDECVKVENYIYDQSLFSSMLHVHRDNILPKVYQMINNYKMFREQEIRLVGLSRLKSWHMKNNTLCCKQPNGFRVIFCDIEIEGREVKRWTQPLFEALDIAIFGLITCVIKGVKQFLVHTMAEIGCFDSIELGPSIQIEASAEFRCRNEIEKTFFKQLQNKKGILFDTMLSEEGGRFYHEQNRNVIIEVAENEIPKLPEGYFWMTFRELNELVQYNNICNIQLRNLLSLLEL